MLLYKKLLRPSYYHHEPTVKHRSHTTISSAILLSVVAGYKVSGVLTERKYKRNFVKVNRPKLVHMLIGHTYTHTHTYLDSTVVSKAYFPLKGLK